MLGSCTPALVNAGALVAVRHKIPMVTGSNPLDVFKPSASGTGSGTSFFDDPDLAAAPVRAIVDMGLQTNKKIAILHDNGPDGPVVGGQFWPEIKDNGLEVVQNASFPVDNTQFTSVLAEAKAKGTDIILMDAITPQGVSPRKQMASAGFTPKTMDIEKGGEPVQFTTALGKLADGVMVDGYNTTRANSAFSRQTPWQRPNNLLGNDI